MRFHGNREQAAVMLLNDGSCQSSTQCLISHHARIMTGASVSALLTLFGCAENQAG